MSDQTPRVPDLRVSPTEGGFVVYGPNVYELRVDTRPVELPADAVKLGDVEALKRRLLVVLDAWGLDGDETSANAVREFYRQLRSIVRGETR